jgi:erythromycin esterase-like protein
MAATLAPTDRRAATIARATAKAHEQARAGNLPTLLRSRFDGEAITELWSIGSRTTGGAVYIVDLRHDADGVTTYCECEAQHAGRVCWHRAAARLAHADAIRSHRAPGVVRFRPRRGTR